MSLFVCGGFAFVIGAALPFPFAAQPLVFRFFRFERLFPFFQSLFPRFEIGQGSLHVFVRRAHRFVEVGDRLFPFGKLFFLFRKLRFERFQLRSPLFRFPLLRLQLRPLFFDLRLLGAQFHRAVVVFGGLVFEVALQEGQGVFVGGEGASQRFDVRFFLFEFGVFLFDLRIFLFEFGAHRREFFVLFPLRFEIGALQGDPGFFLREFRSLRLDLREEGVIFLRLFVEFFPEGVEGARLFFQFRALFFQRGSALVGVLFRRGELFLRLFGGALLFFQRLFRLFQGGFPLGEPRLHLLGVVERVGEGGLPFGERRARFIEFLSLLVQFGLQGIQTRLFFVEFRLHRREGFLLFQKFFVAGGGLRPDFVQFGDLLVDLHPLRIDFFFQGIDLFPLAFELFFRRRDFPLFFVQLGFLGVDFRLLFGERAFLFFQLFLLRADLFFEFVEVGFLRA